MCPMARIAIRAFPDARSSSDSLNSRISEPDLDNNLAPSTDFGFGTHLAVAFEPMRQENQ